MKTDDLIGVLAQDAPLRWTLERSVKLALIVGAVIAGAIFFVEIGFRHDIDDAMETPRFLLKFAVTIPLAVAAAGAVFCAGRPGAEFGMRGWALAISPLILVVAAAVELTLLPESVWARTAMGSNAKHCLTLIPLLSIGPLICLLVALREGAPTNPGLAGAIAGLTASGIAATLYATNCTDDSPLFVVSWYPLATAIVVLMGYLAGRRFLRW